MIHIRTAWSPEYEPLARITYPGKKHYANKWSHTCEYAIYDLPKNIPYKQVIKSRVRHWIDQLDKIPDGDWMWFVASDTLITNPSINIAQYIYEDFDIIGANDCNCINTDSILIKSNDKTRKLINKIFLEADQFRDDQEAFNTFLSQFDNYDDFLQFVGWEYCSESLQNKLNFALNQTDIKFKLVSQKCFNTYSKKFISTNLYHPLPTDGSEWEPTDLMLHMPARSLEYRLKEFPLLVPEEHKGLPFLE